jgi:uncharacterized protein (DUF1810 family)
MTDAPDDIHDLARFRQAQTQVYDQALAELRDGHKQSHWMWFIFPQLRGLGASSTAIRYGIASLAEAKAYLADDVLGPRLRECTQAMLSHQAMSAREILGSPDDVKFRSSMTLFSQASPEPLFHDALLQYFNGTPDGATLEMLGSAKHPS